MDYAPSELRHAPRALKILVAGGFGVGKTTLVSSCSEILPLHTEELLTDASVGTDDLIRVEAKGSTTVVMDFGRVSIRDGLVLYLFGTPGQDRFWFLWDELAVGALGAVVLADTRRLADCFPSVDYFERRGTPFIVAVNCFENAPKYDLAEGGMALNLGPHVPVMLFDGRQRGACKDRLIRLG